MNYYEILKVKKNATTQEIKDSYKTLIKKYHPDIYKGNKEFAEKICKDLNDAYDTLSVPEKRAEYDQSIFQPTNSYNNSNINNTYTQSYTNYYNSYIKNYKQKYSNEKKEETWEQKIDKKFYNFIDKHTQDLNSNKKIFLILCIILSALLAVLLSIKDFLLFVNK